MKKIGIVVSYVVLAVALIIAILYAVGMSVTLEEDKVSYDELQERIESKKIELSDITKELEDNEEHYNKLIQMASDEKELEETISEYKSEVEVLEDEIGKKEQQLKKVDGELTKVLDEPIKVNPGTFYFGEDIEEGRYKVTAQSGQRGNIYFRGDERFAETFGKGSYSIDEYTFNAYHGEEIQFDIPALLYPVE